MAAAGVPTASYSLVRTVEQGLAAVEGLQWVRSLYCYPNRVTQRLLDEITMAKLGMVGTERIQTPRGLHAEQSAAGRRHSDRAADVRTVRDRHHSARRRSNRRPLRRSSKD